MYITCYDWITCSIIQTVPQFVIVQFVRKLAECIILRMFQYPPVHQKKRKRQFTQISLLFSKSKCVTVGLFWCLWHVWRWTLVQLWRWIWYFVNRKGLLNWRRKDMACSLADSSKKVSIWWFKGLKNVCVFTGNG